MKLLLLSHEYPPVGGGAATAARALALNLAAIGNEVTVVTGSYGELDRLTTDGNVAICRIPCLRRRPEQSNVFEMATFMAASVVQLPFILSRHPAEALIIFFTIPSGPAGSLTRLLFGVPYVLSLRGGEVPGLVPELDSIHKLIRPLRRHVLRRAHAIVANSEGLRARAERADGYPVRVISNGVDTEFFSPDPAAAGRAGEPLRILFVGRFQQQKNLPFLFTELARRPIDGFELHLVGDGPERGQLEQLAAKLGIGRAIKWHGWTDRSALPGLYRSADCFVNPSSYEGMPNVVLEAMASGLPVLASNVPGHDELIVHGETGFLFDLQRSNSLAEKFEALAADPNLRSRLGANARARAINDFSWRRVAENYLALFSSHPRFSGR